MKWDGKKISKNGVYDGVPMHAYHSDLCVGPSVSSGGLRTIFNQSPAHYFVKSYLNPNRIEEEDSDAFVLGRAAHHLLLGEDDFSTLFIGRPEKYDSWRTKEAKEWRSDQEGLGRTCLLPSQIEQIRGMARALAAHPLIRAGILNGEVERSIVWRDEETGIWCKSRPDAIPNDSGDFADLKVCASVSDHALRSAIAEYGYHQQGAFVGEGSRVVLNLKMVSFSLVCVEKKPPHCVRVVTLKDGDIERGTRQNKAALRIVANCLKANDWPGPGRADGDYIELPSWAQASIDSQLQFMGAT